MRSWWQINLSGVRDGGYETEIGCMPSVFIERSVGGWSFTSEAVGPLLPRFVWFPIQEVGASPFPGPDDMDISGTGKLTDFLVTLKDGM